MHCGAILACGNYARITEIKGMTWWNVIHCTVWKQSEAILAFSGRHSSKVPLFNGLFWHQPRYTRPDRSKWQQAITVTKWLKTSLILSYPYLPTKKDKIRQLIEAETTLIKVIIIDFSKREKTFTQLSIKFSFRETKKTSIFYSTNQKFPLFLNNQHFIIFEKLKQTLLLHLERI